MTSVTKAFLFVFVLLGACTAKHPAPNASYQADFGSDARTMRVASRVDRYVSEQMETRHIPALSLAVVRDGTLVYARGYGLADIDHEVAATDATVFLIASITKTFTAVATMMLVDDGSITLETPVGMILDDLPVAWRDVTVRQLLDHTSGIRSVTVDDGAPCSDSDKGPATSPRDMLGEVACIPLDFPPGTQWAYNDTGYILLGLIIERISGVSYESFLRNRIFEPLGMCSTRMLDSTRISSGRATGYAWDGEQWRVGPVQTGIEEYAYGGLTSTVQDLALWASALGSKRLLRSESWTIMWTPTMVGDAIYGLGFSVRPLTGRRHVGHTGGGPSAATVLAHFPDERTSIIVLTNTGQPPFSMRDFAGNLASITFSE